jgi:hypothetical protein
MRSVVVSMCVFLGTLRIAQPRILAFLTTFSWSSGSRNARGEMAHSDAGVKKYGSVSMSVTTTPSTTAPAQTQK